MIAALVVSSGAVVGFGLAAVIVAIAAAATLIGRAGER